jgi:hypothetical protein
MVVLEPETFHEHPAPWDSPALCRWDRRMQFPVPEETAMLLVTLHGGSPDSHPHRNNVHAFDKEGKLLTPSVLADAEEILLDELRAICRHGNYLYVIVANKTVNSVLCYEGDNTKYRFVGRFASHQTTPGIVHPFDLTFDDAGFCYVSSQDTNVVTRLSVQQGGRSASAAPVAEALPAEGKFLPGTFVASQVGSLSRPATTPVPAPAGLAFSGEGEKKHSVRGVLWTHHALFVVDQPAGRVKAYNRDGKFLGQSNQVETPTHLAVSGDTLYLTGADAIMRADLRQAPHAPAFEPVPHVHIRNAGGLTVTDAGHIYVASRTENKIFKFDENFKPLPFPCKLPENPEFLLHL